MSDTMRLRIDRDILDRLDQIDTEESLTWRANAVLAEALGLPDRKPAVERKRSGGMMSIRALMKARLARIPTPKALEPSWQGYQPQRRKYDEE